MSDLKINGKITEILPVESGVSKAGKDWQKQTFVIDTGDQFNPLVAFSMFGTEKETLLLQLGECEKENTQLQYEVKLAESRRDEANKRADAVQSTAEKTRSNTTSTIVVKGAEEVVDSTKVKK